MDLRINYPTSENNPYRDKGITSIIVSYIYILKQGKQHPLISSQTLEDGCKILKSEKFSFSKIWKNLEENKINVFPNFKKTLKELEKWFSKNLK